MAGADAVLHAATLHKPHVMSHSRQEFVDTNVTGTLVLLEEAVAAGVGAFVHTSTTSAFGRALTPGEGVPAAWITEDVVPRPRNVYGVTKVAAEDLCELVARDHGLPCVVLRTSRFFPEQDDSEQVRNEYADANVKVNELLYRRVDLSDVVSAHVAALARAPRIGFGRYIVSASTPFGPGDLAELRVDAPAVVQRLFPDYREVYAELGWRMFPGIDRVYVNARARDELGWEPRYDFRHALNRLRAGQAPRSSLATSVGAKGYHTETTGGLHDSLTARSRSGAYCGGNGDDSTASGTFGSSGALCPAAPRPAGGPLRHGRHARRDRAVLGRGDVHPRPEARRPDVGRGARADGRHDGADVDGDPLRRPGHPPERRGPPRRRAVGRGRGGPPDGRRCHLASGGTGTHRRGPGRRAGDCSRHDDAPPRGRPGAGAHRRDRAGDPVLRHHRLRRRGPGPQARPRPLPAGDGRPRRRCGGVRRRRGLAGGGERGTRRGCRRPGGAGPAAGGARARAGAWGLGCPGWGADRRRGGPRAGGRRG